MKRAVFSLAFAVALAAVPATALAYDEAVSGDLSSSPTAPTPLTFVVGNNQVKGTVRNTPPVDLRDYVTFTIPAGRQLTAIKQLSYTNLNDGSPGNTGFHAINLGATSENPDPNGNNEDFYLGGEHLFPVPAGENMLPNLADGDPAGTGFTIPLGPGTHTYLVQQISGAVAYDLQFVVAAPAQPFAAPAPATNTWLLALLTALLGLGGLVSAWRLSAVDERRAS